MPPRTRIRHASRQDAPALAGIIVKCLPHLAQDCLERVIENRILPGLRLCLDNESHTIYIAEENDVVAGYISVHWLPYLFFQGQEGYISELYVQPEYQGKHIGKKLLAQVVEEAESRHCCRLSLLNDKSQESYKRGFYLKKGWTERPDMANFVLWLKPRTPSKGTR